MGYQDLQEDASRLETMVTKQLLRPIAFQLFEDERGHGVRAELPTDMRTAEFVFETSHFSGAVQPIGVKDSANTQGVQTVTKPELVSPLYDGEPVTATSILAQPSHFVGIGDDISSLWTEVFGEYFHTAKQEDHPGEIPISGTDLDSTFESFASAREVFFEDPHLSDLVTAIEDNNYRLALDFLNVDAPAHEVLTPRGDHELSELFTNGDINVVFRNDTIALLKPEQSIRIERDVLRQQARRQAARRGRLNGNESVIVRNVSRIELAYVVGKDDTPTGLFVHAVDGTNLNSNQSTSEDYIMDVMGFDRHYNGEDRLEMNEGERVRLQGDLAIERTSDRDGPSDSSRCNIPIDNHLPILTHGQVIGDKSAEPVRVAVPDHTALNVAHDEHDNVTTQLVGGEYMFYLLPRGAQPRSMRPSWPAQP